jgi:hypothetical protein
MLHSDPRVDGAEHLGSIRVELLKENEQGKRFVAFENPTSMSFVWGKSWLKLPVFISL